MMNLLSDDLHMCVGDDEAGLISTPGRLHKATVNGVHESAHDSANIPQRPLLNKSHRRPNPTALDCPAADELSSPQEEHKSVQFCVFLQTRWFYGKRVKAGTTGLGTSPPSDFT